MRDPLQMSRDEIDAELRGNQRERIEILGRAARTRSAARRAELDELCHALSERAADLLAALELEAEASA